MENDTGTSSAHTAGPWIPDAVLSPDEWEGDYRAQVTTREDADGHCSRVAWACGLTTAECKANARLIAAAPDLYKCARYLRLVCEDRLSIEREERNDPEVIEHYTLLLADADAAIAKVEAAS